MEGVRIGHRNAHTHAHARAIIVGRHLLWVLFLCPEPYKTVHGLGWENYPHASAKIMERDTKGVDHGKTEMAGMV